MRDKRRASSPRQVQKYNTANEEATNSNKEESLTGAPTLVEVARLTHRKNIINQQFLTQFCCNNQEEKPQP